MVLSLPLEVVVPSPSLFSSSPQCLSRCPTLPKGQRAKYTMNLIANPSPNTHILYEDVISLESPLKIKSNVPVTIQRVDELSPLDGAKVVVSSDCASDETTFIPKVDVYDGAVKIEAQPSKGWLESVWFQAYWSVNSCERNLQVTTTSPDGADTNPIDSYCGTDWMDAYYECHLPCPNGVGDCISLGAEYTCHDYTTCNGRIENGAFDGGSSSDGNLTASTVVADLTAVTSTMSSGEIGEATGGATQPARGSTVSVAFSTESTGNGTLITISSQGSTETANLFENDTITTLPSSNGSTAAESQGTAFVPSTSETGDLSETSSTDAVITTHAAATATTLKFTTTEQSTTGATFPSASTSDTASTSTPESSDSTTSSTVDSSEEQVPVPRPTLPPDYYSYKRPSYSPTASPEPTIWTYAPSYMPTSDARGYGFVLTFFAMISIAMVFGVDDKLMFVGIAAATLPFLGNLQVSSNTKQSTGIDGNLQCSYHFDLLVSKCQTIYVDAPLFRVMDTSMANVSFVPRDECVMDYTAMYVGKSEEALTHDAGVTARVNASC